MCTLEAMQNAGMAITTSITATGLYLLKVQGATHSLICIGTSKVVGPPVIQIRWLRV